MITRFLVKALNVFTGFIISLMIIILLLYIVINRGYIAHMGFVNALEADMPQSWLYDTIGIKHIHLDSTESTYSITYFTSDFFFNRNMEINDKNPYIILGKSKNNAEIFLDKHKENTLNKEYTIKISFINTSGYPAIYLTNGEPNWLLSIANRSREHIPIDKLDKSNLFSYLLAIDVSLKELELLSDLQILIVDDLILENAEDLKFFTDLKYLDYRHIINHTDIPDESIKDEIQKILPDCVIQDSGDTIVKE